MTGAATPPQRRARTHALPHTMRYRKTLCGLSAASTPRHLQAQRKSSCNLYTCAFSWSCPFGAIVSDLLCCPKFKASGMLTSWSHPRRHVTSFGSSECGYNRGMSLRLDLSLTSILALYGAVLSSLTAAVQLSNLRLVLRRFRNLASSCTSRPIASCLLGSHISSKMALLERKSIYLSRPARQPFPSPQFALLQIS